MSEPTLRTFSTPLEPLDRARMLDDPDWSPRYATDVMRSDGAPVSLVAFNHLMEEFHARSKAGEWADDRASSDRWLAPRVHWALRLTRAQAADRAAWTWLALSQAEYVDRRWADPSGGVNEDRWTGAVNKQAFARLWWGAELFRDGPDYGPVVRAFVHQDLTNSYLHRPFVRCRPLALALLDVAAPAGADTRVLADDVNDLARVVNLATAGAPPEAETGHLGDDVAGYLRWVRGAVDPPTDWDTLPQGPDCSDTTAESMDRAAAIASRCLGFARSAADARGSRSARRRAARDRDTEEPASTTPSP